MAEPGSSRPYWQTRGEVLAAIRAEAAADPDPDRSYLDLLEGLVVDAALERDGELAEARRVILEGEAALGRAETLPTEIHAWLNDLAVAHPDHAALISELAELFERRWLADRARAG